MDVNLGISKRKGLNYIIKRNQFKKMCYLPTTVAMIRIPKRTEVTHMMTIEDQLEAIPAVPFDETNESLRL